MGTLHVTGFSVGAKGRVVIPAALRAAAGMEEGVELVGLVAGEGRIVLETREAVRRRVWAAAPDGGPVEATSDVRAMRLEDATIADANAARRSDQGGEAETSERLGQELLRSLGL